MKKLLFTSFMAILALGLAGCRENDLSSSLPSTTPEVSDKTGSDAGKSTTPEQSKLSLSKRAIMAYRLRNPVILSPHCKKAISSRRMPKSV